MLGHLRKFRNATVLPNCFNYLKILFCSSIIPLPQVFVEYLQDNGTLVMPKGVLLRQGADEKAWEGVSWEDGLEEVIKVFKYQLRFAFFCKRRFTLD